MTPDIRRPVHISLARRAIRDVLRIGIGWAIGAAILWAGFAGLYVSLAPLSLSEKLVQASFTATHNGLMGALIGFAFGVAVALLSMTARAALRSAP